MRLVDIYSHGGSGEILYRLLGERTPEQSISHKGMPTMEEHRRFIRRHPYRAWYLLLVEGDCVGSAYLTHDREIGIFVFNEFQNHGHGAEAIRVLMKQHPGRFFANVAPTNERSAGFFLTMGFRHIQNTYALEAT